MYLQEAITHSNGGEKYSMRIKLTVFICSLVTLFVALALDQVVIYPIVNALSEALPCNMEGQWQETCINNKNLLALVPYVSTFGSVMVFLKKTGIVD